MPILTIRHVTTDRYKRPVSFGEHRMRLCPRDDDDQKVLASELDITPGPSQLSWSQDTFGNHVATARFGDRALELRSQAPSGRPASVQLISKILREPIGLPMPRRIGPASRHSPRRHPPTPSIAGPPGPSAKTDRPTPASRSPV